MRFSLLRDASGTANLFSNSGTYWRRTGAGRWPIVRVLRGTRIHAEVAPPTVGWRPGFSSIDVGSRGCFHTADDSKFSVFSEARRLHDRNDVIVVADLDPHTARDTWIHLDMPALGVGYGTNAPSLTIPSPASTGTGPSTTSCASDEIPGRCTSSTSSGNGTETSPC